MGTVGAGGGRQAFLEADLPASDAPSVARTLVRQLLQRPGVTGQTVAELDACVFDTALVVSELVTNAIRYGDPPVRLRVCAFPGCVRIEVSDTGRQLPRLRRADGDALGGRGLCLVATVCDAWGVTRDADGKTVFATVPRPHDRATAVPTAASTD